MDVEIAAQVIALVAVLKDVEIAVSNHVIVVIAIVLIAVVGHV